MKQASSPIGRDVVAEDHIEFLVVGCGKRSADVAWTTEAGQLAELVHEVVADAIEAWLELVRLLVLVDVEPVGVAAGRVRRRGAHTSVSAVRIRRSATGAEFQVSAVGAS
jgi:hypothetical protein